MPDGFCMAHSPNRAELRREQRSRGGKLTQARKALAKVKRDAIAKLGIETPLPTLDSVEACQEFVVQTAGRVLRQEISPAQANALTNLIRLSKDLISLHLDVQLADELVNEPPTEKGSRRRISVGQA